MFSNFFAPAVGFARAAMSTKDEASRPEPEPRQATADSSNKQPAHPGLSRSRSTSVGSSGGTSGGAADAGQAQSPPAQEDKSNEGLPDFEYPVPFVIRNTFIDTPLTRPVSLDEFMEERKINSCPASGIGLPPGLSASGCDQMMQDARFVAEVSKALQHPQLARTSKVMVSDHQPYHISTPLFGSEEYPAGLGDTLPSSRTVPPPPAQWAPVLEQALVPPPPQAIAEQANDGPKAQILQLAEALPEPELGTEDCPTLGSRGHGIGNCKPCAFVHTKGCENGINCIFCHLCEPGEKKRRAKEKKERRREVRRWGGLL